MGKLLHRQSQIDARFCLRVINEENNLVTEMYKKSDSFVRNFILLLQAAVNNTAVSVTDTSGTSRSCLGFNCTISTYGVTNSGIIVGTGTNPVSASDYNLQSQDLTLEYAPHLVSQPASPIINGGYIESNIIIRSFNNKTATPVNISELGIVVTSSTYKVLILRDLLETPVTVNPNQTLLASYFFRTAI